MLNTTRSAGAHSCAVFPGWLFQPPVFVSPLDILVVLSFEIWERVRCVGVAICLTSPGRFVSCQQLVYAVNTLAGTVRRYSKLKVCAVQEFSCFCIFIFTAGSMNSILVSAICSVSSALAYFIWFF